MFDDGHEWRWGGVREAAQQACVFINQTGPTSWRHVSIKVLTSRQMNWLIKVVALPRLAKESEIIMRRQFVIISERKKHIEWLFLITAALTSRSRLYSGFKWGPVRMTSLCVVVVAFFFFDTPVKCFRLRKNLFLMQEERRLKTKKNKPGMKGWPITCKQEVSFNCCTEFCRISQSEPLVLGAYFPLSVSRLRSESSVHLENLFFLQSRNFLAPQQDGI